MGHSPNNVDALTTHYPWTLRYIAAVVTVILVLMVAHVV